MINKPNQSFYLRENWVIILHVGGVIQSCLHDLQSRGIITLARLQTRPHNWSQPPQDILPPWKTFSYCQALVPSPVPLDPSPQPSGNCQAPRST